MDEVIVPDEDLPVPMEVDEPDSPDVVNAVAEEARQKAQAEALVPEFLRRSYDQFVVLYVDTGYVENQDRTYNEAYDLGIDENTQMRRGYRKYPLQYKEQHRLAIVRLKAMLLARRYLVLKVKNLKATNLNEKRFTDIIPVALHQYLPRPSAKVRGMPRRPLGVPEAGTIWQIVGEETPSVAKYIRVLDIRIRQIRHDLFSRWRRYRHNAKRIYDTTKMTTYTKRHVLDSFATVIAFLQSRKAKAVGNVIYNLTDEDMHGLIDFERNESVDLYEDIKRYHDTKLSPLMEQINRVTRIEMEINQYDRDSDFVLEQYACQVEYDKLYAEYKSHTQDAAMLKQVTDANVRGESVIRQLYDAILMFKVDISPEEIKKILAEEFSVPELPSAPKLREATGNEERDAAMRAKFDADFADYVRGLQVGYAEMLREKHSHENLDKAEWIVAEAKKIYKSITLKMRDVLKSIHSAQDTLLREAQRSLLGLGAEDDRYDLDDAFIDDE